MQPTSASRRAAVLALLLPAAFFACRPNARCIRLDEFAFDTESEPGVVKAQGSWLDEAGKPRGFNAHVVEVVCRKARMTCSEALAFIMPSVQFAGQDSPPMMQTTSRGWKVESWDAGKIIARTVDLKDDGTRLELDLKAGSVAMLVGGDKPRRDQLGSAAPYCPEKVRRR